MIKKYYQKPTLNVVQLQQQQHILAGSDIPTLRGSKGEDDDPDIWYELGARKGEDDDPDIWYDLE